MQGEAGTTQPEAGALTGTGRYCPDWPWVREEQGGLRSYRLFTRERCSWNCPSSSGGSMHVNWKISCGDSGLIAGHLLRPPLKVSQSRAEGQGPVPIPLSSSQQGTLSPGPQGG